MPKFTSATKCELLGLKCLICEYEKGYQRITNLSLNSQQVSDLNSTIGALKVTHLKPGAQVSVKHFQSRVLGRTYDSFGKVNFNTYKGGCIFVDHISGYIFVEHQLGFLAIETIRAKQAFEGFALSVEVYIESYLTDSGALKGTSFVKHIQDHNQHIKYCEANAHHKNRIPELGISYYQFMFGDTRSMCWIPNYRLEKNPRWQPRS
jgi:hypothetical protein